MISNSTSEYISKGNENRIEKIVTLMLYSVIHNSSFILSVAKVMTVLILDKAGFREEFYQG